MTYNNDWKPTENNMPDTFHPTPQTPEQVENGLRNAFRQAKKDGVMDATPYLKQMTFNSDIEKTEAEIKVLQKKLELLKEIETHKSLPKMNFELGGKFEIVFYNGENYSRHEFDDGSHNWYKRKFTDEGVVMLVAITDTETRRLLEGLWFNDVRKGKYGGPYCPDEPEHYDEVEHDISENIENKTLKEVINRWWMDTFTSKNQWDVDTCIDDLADQIEFWILRNKK